MPRCIALPILLSILGGGCSIAGLPATRYGALGVPTALVAQANVANTCGYFSVTEAVPHTSGGGVRFTLKFYFDTVACTDPPDDRPCNRVVYVQLIRANNDKGESLLPFAEYKERMVTDPSSDFYGWSIDQGSKLPLGYYGTREDREFDSSLCTPGTDLIAAVLKDRPSGWLKQVTPGKYIPLWFEAVAVPVCIDTMSPCAHGIARFYYWRFEIDGAGNTTGPVHYAGTAQHSEAFAMAVKAWNAVAPSRMKELFPAFKPLP